MSISLLLQIYMLAQYAIMPEKGHITQYAKIGHSIIWKKDPLRHNAWV